MATSIDTINKDLISEMEIEQLFQKHIVDGPSHFFYDVLNDGDQEYKLRSDIANSLSINLNDVVLVGSGKLGFSVKDAKFTKFDEKYAQSGLVRDRSDLDLAIVSRKAFERETELLFSMSRHFSSEWIKASWLYNVYYPDREALQRRRIGSLFTNYTKYLARGWLRQDYAPNQYIDQTSWKPVVDNWYRLTGRRITIGLYSDWYYLKHYHLDNLLNLRLKRRSLEV